MYAPNTCNSIQYCGGHWYFPLTRPTSRGRSSDCIVKRVGAILASTSSVKSAWRKRLGVNPQLRKYGQASRRETRPASVSLGLRPEAHTLATLLRMASTNCTSPARAEDGEP